MNGLPFIDEHSLHVAASPTEVWPALVSVLRTDFGSVPAAPTKVLLGIEPAQKSGSWREQMAIGDTLPGFQLTAFREPERLVLEGRHRFSTYALVFEIEPLADGSLLKARTWAEFPGPQGRLYRAAVIGSGGHRILVRRLLRSIARRA